MSTYLPKVGDKGFYILKAPFDTLQNQKLECIRISRLTDLSNSIDVYGQVYLEQSISQEIYDEHLDRDIQIALMIHSSGEETYIPVNFFSSFVQTSSHSYISRIICLNLGNIPEELSTDHLANEIKTLGESLVGKEGLDVMYVDEPVNELITDELHETLETQRLANVSQIDNPYVKIGELEDKVAKLEETIRIYEEAYLSSS